MSALAQARDVADLKLSPDKPEAQNDYKGGAALLANDNDKTQSPTVCRTAEHCDVIDLNITVPDGYEDPWALRITLSFPAGPDLDMTLYTDGEKLLASAWTSNNPEIITLKYMDPGLYYITVLQFDNVNVVYNVLAEFLPLQQTLPKKKSTSTTLTSPPPPRPFAYDPYGGDEFGSFGRFGLTPDESSSSLQASALDLGGDEAPPKRVGFGPEKDDEAVLSSVRFDGDRVALGLGSVASVALLSYGAFFLPRRVRPKRKPTTA